MFGPTYVVDTYQQDPLSCIEESHASYLLNYWAFNGNGTGYTDTQLLEAETAARSLGYQFSATEAELHLSNLQGTTLDIQLDLKLENMGNAPFYYPLMVHLLWDGHDMELVELQDLLPGTTLTATINLPERAAAMVEKPIQIIAYSEHVLSNQRLRLANLYNEEDKLELLFTPTCQLEDETISIGEQIMRDGQLCTCDVDTLLYTLDGALCSAP